MHRPVLSMILSLASLGCMSGDAETQESETQVLRLAVTTSTRDSGLLDQLLPPFETAQNARVDVIAVGTGAALKLGESGDADAVLVHARAAEEAFMAAGHGVRHEEIMFNSFVIVGPENDPAGVSGLSPEAALTQIAESKSKFISRGDDSGTHKRELSLWTSVNLTPDSDDYIENGQGMGATLTMADELKAYTLSDHGTYLKMKSKLDLVPLVKEGEVLRNPYGLMVVNPEKHSAMNEALAQAFADYMISPQAQGIIQDYRIEGEPLFVPLRLDDE